VLLDAYLDAYLDYYITGLVLNVHGHTKKSVLVLDKELFYYDDLVGYFN